MDDTNIVQISTANVGKNSYNCASGELMYYRLKRRLDYLRTLILHITNVPRDWDRADCKNVLFHIPGSDKRNFVYIARHWKNGNMVFEVMCRSPKQIKLIYNHLKMKYSQDNMIKVVNPEFEDVNWPKFKNIYESYKQALESIGKSPMCEKIKEKFFGVSTKVLNDYNISEMSNVVEVKNLDIYVSAQKLREVFAMAGPVVRLSCANGVGQVAYLHPLEAFQAILLFNAKKLYSKVMTVTFKEIFDPTMGCLLPEGLESIGPGLGQDDSAIHNFAFLENTAKIKSVIRDIFRIPFNLLGSPMPYNTKAFEKAPFVVSLKIKDTQRKALNYNEGLSNPVKTENNVIHSQKSKETSNHSQSVTPTADSKEDAVSKLISSLSTIQQLLTKIMPTNSVVTGNPMLQNDRTAFNISQNLIPPNVPLASQTNAQNSVVSTQAPVNTNFMSNFVTPQLHQALEVPVSNQSNLHTFSFHQNQPVQTVALNSNNTNQTFNSQPIFSEPSFSQNTSSVTIDYPSPNIPTPPTHSFHNIPPSQNFQPTVIPPKKLPNPALIQSLNWKCANAIQNRSSTTDGAKIEEFKKGNEKEKPTIEQKPSSSKLDSEWTTNPRYSEKKSSKHDRNEKEKPKIKFNIKKANEQKPSSSKLDSEWTTNPRYSGKKSSNYDRKEDKQKHDSIRNQKPYSDLKNEDRKRHSDTHRPEKDRKRSKYESSPRNQRSPPREEKKSPYVGSLLFHNLPDSVDQEALEQKLKEICQVHSVYRLDKGRACVKIIKSDDLERCFKLFNGAKVDGQIIETKIIYA